MTKPPLPPVFDPAALMSPWGLWRAGFEWMSAWQRLWLAAMSGQVPGGLPVPLMQPGALPGPFSSEVLKALLPQVDVQVERVPTEGALAGADEAARVSLRMRMPTPGFSGPAEWVMVEALVARVHGDEPPALAGDDGATGKLPGSKGA